MQIKDKLYIGDHVEIMKEFIPDKSVQLIKTDLPFGTTNCEWDTPVDLPTMWEQYERIIKDNGVILLNAQLPFDKVLGCSNLKLLRYEWIWEKTAATGHFNAKKMPMKAHENVLVFYKKLPIYNPQKTIGHSPVNTYTKPIGIQNVTEIYGKVKTEIKGGGATDRYPRSIQVFKSDRQKNKLHPTQKPLGLEEYFITTYTNEGDLVLDSCCGSGTTGEACQNLNRRFILIDKYQKWYNVSKKRLKL